MTCYMLYQIGTEGERPCRDLARDLERRQVKVELVEADSPQGSHLAELYDLLSRPAVVLVREDGSAVERWQHTLPTASDVSYLAHQ
jgi:hypothetical protein